MAKRQSSSSSPSSISILNGDLLVEVFLRLPHRRSLIQCSLVCKQWSSVISCPHFSQKFIKFHHEKRCSGSDSSSYSLPYTVSFISTFHNKWISFGEILSKKSKILLGKQPSSSSSSSSSCLYQNSLPAETRIRASCDDLLLISKFVDYRQRYGICNPLTRQLLWLPDVPRIRYLCPERCGLMCELKNDIHRFKVLIYGDSSINDNDSGREVIIFCSETWKWTNLNLSFLPKLHYLGDFVAGNGILYAPKGGEVKGFVAIDLSVDDANPKQYRYIVRPNDFRSEWLANNDNVCYGVVRGKLRLAQMYKYDTKEYELKVWELMEIDNNWVLMHSIRLRRAKTDSKFLAAFHPYNGNVIFISHNHEIYEYKIEKNRCSHKRICQLGGPDLPSRKEVTENGWIFFKPFTLVFPSWPTPIPISPNV